MEITIIPFELKHQPDFERLNRYWIERYFKMEEMDKIMLLHPEQAIIERGGHIFMALADGEVAGTVALRKISPRRYELAKMAVDELFHRKGIARKLAIAAIEKAISLGADLVELHSHTSLQPALTLYKQLGFREVPIDESEFARSDIKMELDMELYQATKVNTASAGLESR